MQHILATQDEEDARRLHDTVNNWTFFSEWYHDKQRVRAVKTSVPSVMQLTNGSLTEELQQVLFFFVVVLSRYSFVSDVESEQFAAIRRQQRVFGTGHVRHQL